MRCLVLLSSGLLCLTGCVSLEQIDPSFKGPKLTQVSTNPFGGFLPFTQSTRKIPYNKADAALLQRVMRVGNYVLDSNPEIGLRPSFAATGSDSVEVFHQGPHAIYITKGLIERCKTDEQLAAVLCHELGEMVFERELLAGPKMQEDDERPPMRVQIGNAGQPGEADFVHMAEVARYEQRKKERQKQRKKLPNPELLRVQYLTQAGFQAEVYEEIKPLLAEAERTYSLEKQFKRHAVIPPTWNTPSSNSAPQLQRPQPTETPNPMHQPQWTEPKKKL